ncbi:glycoside hydrolase family 99-like domain-containing protein [Lentzea sp. NPDC058450]|uniref:glycoside hydrolase family 99-like domain-containing protein n=1 Tax=Lentzea sp. NPDC058450 TaxID=3346505 RepID=UPI003667398E
MTTRPKILAYYFPSWHKDSRNAQWFGTDWEEWELLKTATPRFPGHRQPRVPALGYQDDADPRTFDVQIPLATEHGVDGFIFDYYWYDDGPFLQRALDEGFLGSERNTDVEFAIMWANHELTNIFPAARKDSQPTLKRGEIDREQFERMTDHVVEHYFSRPNYLKVDGKPWFSLYEVGRLVSGLGSLEATAEALRSFRDKTIAAGHPGLHVDAVLWGFGVLPAATMLPEPFDLIDQLGFLSASSYVWIHHSDTLRSDFPQGDWLSVGRDAFEDYRRSAKALDVPVYPNVTVGWDSSPRTSKAEEFSNGTYPWTPVWDGTPDEFRWGLEQAKEFLEEHPVDHPLVTVNAWNEWTEGSALLPDRDRGLAYLQAIHEVFGPAEKN